jgi:hypothetical protein
MMQHAPDILRASQLDPKDIRHRIVGDITERGLNLWDVQNSIDQYAAESARTNPTYSQVANSKELRDFAAKVQSQWDALTAARMRPSSSSSSGAGAATDFYAKSGMPSPDMRYSPQDIAPDFFNKYAQDTMARQDELAMLARSVAKQQKASKYLEPKTPEKEPQFWEIGKIMNRPEAQRVTGKEYGRFVGKQDSSGTAEEIRFQNIAKGIVASKGKDINYQQRRDEITARQKYDDEVAQLVAEGLNKKMAEAGYTPFMNALMQRAQFLGMGRGA